MIQTDRRTTQTEIMDDFELKGEELRDALDKIAEINRWLGGNQLTIDGLRKLLPSQPNNREFVIMDIGCGNGDMCREVARWGRKQGYQFRIIGIDANTFTIDHARTCSTAYPEISYQMHDVFQPEFSELSYDVVLATLTIHHFSDPEILYLLNLFNVRARLGVVINDLHRSKLAYRLFELVCSVFRLPPMVREDGLISILRGFKKQELLAYSRQVSFAQVQVIWKWAFRYQWILRQS